MTLFQKEDPRNLGGGWPSSARLGTWSSCHRRLRGAPMSKRRRYSYGPKPGYEPPRRKPKQPHGPGPWFQPPLRPCWYPDWGRCGGPWGPPPAQFRKPPCLVEMMQVYGVHPLCHCSCSCWCAPWNPGWASPPCRKKRWGRRGRLRRPPRRSFPRSPPVDQSMLLQPVNLYSWRAPGMRAPRNTTQYLMNQIYQDLRQQEKLERRQMAQGAQQVPPGSAGGDAPPSDGEENGALQETFYSYLQDPSLALSPVQVQEKESPPQPVVEEEAGEEMEEEEEEEEELELQEEREEEEEEEEELELQEECLEECNAEEEYEEEEFAGEEEESEEEEEEAGTEDEDVQEEEEEKEGGYEEERKEEEKEREVEEQGLEEELRDI
ncbi:hypothetical protein GW7_13646 [Heterocephalus glaber]|uniref:Coiled-coil domain-containing glutamate-rich protein 1 n=1 Tax=Heterocephalus glaber TaxID=10181 RepID=G5BSJ2_HETGA|nr:hypothetical protein GW7_13646 [Heterocephalus glaber]